MSDIAKVEISDVIYAIDVISDEAIRHFFEQQWNDFPPVLVIMEGAESEGPLIYPKDSSEPEWACIIAPSMGLAVSCMINDLHGLSQPLHLSSPMAAFQAWTQLRFPQWSNCPPLNKGPQIT